MSSGSRGREGMLAAERAAIEAAIALVQRTPGFTAEADDLRSLLNRDRLRIVSAMADRGQATLTGRLLIGAEALDGSLPGLAETLVHEHYHLRRQRSLEKTASFWIGVATGRHVMLRYEAPAYRAAVRFLTAMEQSIPEWAMAARMERNEILAAFEVHYGVPLTAA